MHEKKLYSYLSIICYVVSFIILLFCIRIKVIPNLDLNPNIRLILLLIICILVYIGGLILVKKLDYDKKILKVNLIIYFLIYTVTIFSLTLFEEIYGRQGLILIEWDKELLNYYLNTSFNIIPFKTVKLFIEGYNSGMVSFNSFGINVIGNFLAFMPYGIFFPLIFKSMRKYFKFLITMIIIVVIIELLQFSTMSGSCDIDDLILNVVGSSVVYFITRIRFINNLIERIFLFK